MDIGNDISQKIRTAIKAKLEELAAYVDDELPDYIMVMVANKKSENQMTEDLGLFLGVNTEKFTSCNTISDVAITCLTLQQANDIIWLHELLNKLQNLNTDKKKNQEIKKTDVNTKKAESAVDNRKHSIDKPVPSTSKATTKTRSTKTTTLSDKKDLKRSKEEEYIPEILDKTETDEFSEEFNKEEEGKKVSVKVNVTKPQQVKTNVARQSSSNSSSSHPKSQTSESKPTAKAKIASTTPNIRPSFSDTSHVRPLSRPGSIKSRLGAPVPRAVASPQKRPSSSHQDRKVSPPKKKKPMSVIGTVVRQFTKEFEEEEEEEEYDQSNPVVASVIKVTDRKSSVPLSLQAKPSLLMKAVTAAEKSVSSTLQQVLQEEKMYSARAAPVKPVKPTVHVSRSRDMASRQRREERDTRQSINAEPRQQKHGITAPPITVTLTAKVKDKSGIELTSKSRREELLRNMTYTIENDVEKPRKQPEVARVPPVMDSRLVQCIPKMEAEHVEEIEIQEEEVIEEEEEEDGDQELLQKAAEVLHSGSEMIDSPAAEDIMEEEVEESQIMEEVDDKMEEEKEEEEKMEQLEEEEEGEAEENMNDPDPEIQQLLTKDTDLDIDEQEDLMTQNQQIPQQHTASVSDSRRFIQEKIKSLPVAKVNPKFIVTLDGVDVDRYEGCYVQQKETIPAVVCQEEVTPPVIQVSPKEAMLKVKMQEIKPISISLKDTSDEEEEEYDEDKHSPLAQAKMKERCKFWPACVNGNSCSFHHPTVPCKMFPQCKFKDKCLYIHPNCKFDAKCTRNDCPFTHASKRGPVTTVIQKIVQIPVTQNPAAAQSFLPNKAPSSTTCRFFPNCKNMSCPFVHPTPCRFGLACTRKSTCTFYHPPLPGKDKLKWTAEKPKEHISNRKFDASGPVKKIPT